MTKRTTLRERGKPALYGRHGRRVRAYQEERTDQPTRIVVSWSEGRRGGKRTRTKVFPATEQGRRDAMAYAKGQADRLTDRPITSLGRMTLRDLFERFKAIEFPRLRSATKSTYESRWQVWERTWGANFIAEDTTIPMVDTFILQERKLEHSPNQTRNILNVVKVVYRWGAVRDYLPPNKITLYRWKWGEDDGAHEPGEYSTDNRAALLAALNPERALDWRAYVALVVMGYQGIRANACLHLSWPDVLGDEILWPKRYQKNRNDFRQPLTPQAAAALTIARQWRERDGYTGPLVFYPTRRSGWATGATYSYQSLWYHLRRVEEAAGIPHQDYRAFHGLRRMVAGEVLEGTGNAKLAMEYIGDHDLKQMKSYLKRRESRLREAAAVLSRAPENPDQTQTTPLERGSEAVESD